MVSINVIVFTLYIENLCLDHNFSIDIVPNDKNEVETNMA